MSRLKTIDPDTATGKAAELLGAVKSSLGTVPNLTKVMANQPAVLDMFLAISGALSKGAFDPRTREAIALTVAGANGCDYCASAHSAISQSLNVDPTEIEHRLAGRSEDPKLNALLVFARKIVDARGLVSDADLAQVKAAGYDESAITEVTANVVANIFTNYINQVADTEIDFPVVRTGNLAPAA